MSATPTPDGGDVPEGDRWEKVGRQLLIEQLEQVALETVRDAFIGAAGRLDAGEELTEDDVQEMRDAIEDAKRAVEIAAESSPETEPMPELWEFLDEDAQSEYVTEAQRRLSDDE